MSAPATDVSVTIFNKSFVVKCPQDKMTALQAASQLVDERMRSVSQSGQVSGVDRVAILTALNIAHELLSGSEASNNAHSTLTTRIDRLHQKLHLSLASEEAAQVE